MLKKRLAQISNPKKKTDLRTRHVKLQEIEGWYKTDILIPLHLQPTYQRYIDSQSTLKFTRWLLRNTNYTEGEVSEIGKQLVKCDFKISCRLNDLVRLGDSPHYKSCMRFSQSFQQVHYVVDPDMAIVYIPDTAGKFLWRTLIRLVCDEKGEFALVYYKPYGNGPEYAIVEAVTKHTGLKMIKADYLSSGMDSNFLSSATKIGNPLLNKPHYTDHRLEISKKNKIQIESVV